MKILIVYASKYGQTEKIAAAIAETARHEHADVRMANVKALPRDPDLRNYDAVVLAAPVYYGHFLKPLQRFVRRNIAALSAVRTAFVAVSLSAKFEPQTADELVHTFVRDTGWLPETFTCVAGTEAFTRYGLFTGYVMRKIARQHGRAGDFSKDCEYTDWDALAQFTRELVARLARKVSASAVAAPL